MNLQEKSVLATGLAAQLRTRWLRANPIVKTVAERHLITMLLLMPSSDVLHAAGTGRRSIIIAAPRI